MRTTQGGLKSKDSVKQKPLLPGDPLNRDPLAQDPLSSTDPLTSKDPLSAELPTDPARGTDTPGTELFESIMCQLLV